MDYSTLLPTANAIRAIAMDAVQKANSGHPGAPMGMADIAEVLWRQFLQHNPAHPQWVNRDRFVLSNGHASMLLYALLHLSGYDLSMEDIKNFRQMGAPTPGHPEFGITAGVETTTGPLGQGLANAVGMALAEKILAARFNKPDHPIINHYTYVFVGDGCLMEGISHEACSLAGTWGLNKLIVFYDANSISIDGNIRGWFTDDTAMRFESYGWRVIRAVDGHSAKDISQAINLAREESNKPTLIICQTIIGCGAPHKGGSADTHGAPLGAEEISATRSALGWHAAPFVIPDEIAQAWNARARGQALEDAWQAQFKLYQQAYPEDAQSFLNQMHAQDDHALTPLIDQMMAQLQAQEKPIATRKASELCLRSLVGSLPSLIGGSADLAGSNLTDAPQSLDYVAHIHGDKRAHINRLSFGVREFGMGAIANGLSLHGGFRVFIATFLVFSDYLRNAIRMASLMRQPLIYVFTHDSIGLGEDGPTHQPIEHLPSLRMIPNLNVWRPADAIETGYAWQAAIRSTQTPHVLALSRQALPPQKRTVLQTSAIAQGGYVLSASAHPRAVVIATGSEVALAMAAQDSLAQKGININVVSMPCVELFRAQSAEYQQEVLPDDLPKIAVEAAYGDYWRAWVGMDGEVIGMHTFGESAPAAQLFSHFGFTVERIEQSVRRLIG